MLSQCFDELFLRLPMSGVNVDSLLQLWLTLSDDVSAHENDTDAPAISTASFDPRLVPQVDIWKLIWLDACFFLAAAAVSSRRSCLAAGVKDRGPRDYKDLGLGISGLFL